MKDIFIQSLKDSGIDCDVDKFYHFCRRASYFNGGYDKRFYEYAAMELRHRVSYSILEMFEKFKNWNNGKKHFKVYERGFPQHQSTIEAKTRNQAKYKFSYENSIEYSKLGCSISYPDCL